MKSVLIKKYDIPENVRKMASKYRSIELYNDRIIGKDSDMLGDVTYLFKNYTGVTWTRACLLTQYAFVVLITPETGSHYIHTYNAQNFADMNKIPFCSGLYSYSAANEYAQSLCMDIKKAMNEYRENAEKEEADSTNQIQLSVADEIKKFKELLDDGVITQEEFETKKTQLLNL